MPDVALGTKVFKRTEKLHQLLQSVPEDFIGHVYIADDGDTSDREEIYAADWPFDLTVLDLDYDAGLGYGRQQIVEALDEPYLLVVDSDHTIPANVRTLYHQLSELSTVGGIAGSIVEPEHGRLWQSAKDLYEEDGGLIRDAAGKREIEFVAGIPFARFDFIPNAALFRRECIEDYCWDPKIKIGSDHIDFYVGHWKTTDWEFGVSPGVFFGHYPGGGTAYDSSRHNELKNQRYRKYFLNKWGYESDRIKDSYWFDTETHDTTIKQDINRILTEKGPVSLVSKGLKWGVRTIHYIVRKWQ